MKLKPFFEECLFKQYLLIDWFYNEFDQWENMLCFHILCIAHFDSYNIITEKALTEIIGGITLWIQIIFLCKLKLGW